MNRKTFIKQVSLGFGGAWALAQLPYEAAAKKLLPYMDMALGFQTYPIRNMLAKDFPGVLKTMAGFGYQQLELCSPQGYADSGFGFLTNRSPGDIRKTINDAGLSCSSCHYDFKEFGDQLDQRIEFAQKLGLTQMICSTFWLPKDALLRDYLEAADKLNKAAEKIKRSGMETGFHNHEFEFAILEGQLIYDALMSRFDPALVKMQFQTEVINLGYKASTYFNKYPGRFISSHLSDWTADKKEVPLGQGIIDWKDFFAAAKVSGVKNYFVEMHFDTFKDSASFIKNL